MWDELVKVQHESEELKEVRNKLNARETENTNKLCLVSKEN